MDGAGLSTHVFSADAVCLEGGGGSSLVVLERCGQGLLISRGWSTMPVALINVLCCFLTSSGA